MASQSTHSKSGQIELRQALMDKLAELAGISSQLHGEDTIKRIAGAQIGLPEGMPLDTAETVIRKAREDEEQVYQVGRTFKYRPFDGAYAMQNVLRQYFGWSVGQPTRTLFGKRPPELISIEIDYGVQAQVPWGRLGLPHFDDGYIDLTVDHDDQMGQLFHVNVTVKRKYQDKIQGLFTAIEMELLQNSIYRGKAITASDTPQFIDVSGIEFDDIVYSEQVAEDIEVFIWANILYPQALRDVNQLGKRLTIVYGTYGVGKTELARLTAKLAVIQLREGREPCGFIMVRPGVDNWMYAIQMARIYGRCVIFIEDADLLAPNDPRGISMVLDQLDGLMVKGLDISLVFTTNHIDRIQKGVLRPGRTDGLIEIGPMDRPGVEKLARRVIGSSLEDDIDFDAVFAAMEGFAPAWVKEAFDRSMRRNIVRNHGVLSTISGHDLIGAAMNLRPQLKLMDDAPEGAQSVDLEGWLQQAFARASNSAVQRALNGASVYDEDDEFRGYIRPAG